MTDASSRYARQERLPFVGTDGQSRLANAHAMVIGIGALGCPAADLLVRAGVGRVTLIDRDTVELSNLHRQTLYTEADARGGVPKAVAAAARLRAANGAVAIDAIVDDFTADAAEAMLRPHPRPDVVLDCTDNFEARYVINDAAVKLEIPLCYAGCVGAAATAMTVLPGETACLRCVFPDPPAAGSQPTCDSAGVFAPAAMIVAAAQAGDALKIMLGERKALGGTLLAFDLWHNRRQRMDLRDAKDPGCPCCALRRFEFLGGAGRAAGTAADRARSGSAGACTVLCGKNAVQLPAPRGGAGQVDLTSIAQRLESLGEWQVSAHTLTGTLHTGWGASRRSQDGREVADAEATGEIGLTLFADGRAIIHGTTDPAIARAVYARLIGS